MFLMTMLFVTYAVAISVLPSVIAAPLMASFHISPIKLALLSSMYFYPYMLMQVPGGILIDRFGARKVVTVSLCICSFGVLLFAISPDFYSVLLARILMGAGSCTAFVSFLVVSRIQFQGRYFAFLSGLAIVAAAIGAIYGQVFVSYALMYINWRTCLLGLSLIGLGLTIMNWWGLKNLPYVYAKSQTSLFKNLKVLLLNSQIRFIAFFAFLNAVPLGAFADLWGVPFFQKAYTMDPKSASILCSMIWIGLAISSPLIGYFSDKLKKERLVLMLLSIISVACTFAILHVDTIAPATMKIIMFFLGIACSGQAITFVLIMKNTPTYMAATANGINNMTVVATPLFFQVLIGGLMNYRNGSVDMALYSLRDYIFSMSILPVMSLLALLVCYFFIKEPKPPLTDTISPRPALQLG